VAEAGPSGASKLRVDLLAIGLLLVLTAVLFLPVAAFVVGEDDYRSHLIGLNNLLLGEPFRLFVVQAPHFLFHLLVLAVYRAAPGTSLTSAAFVVAVAAYLAGALAIYGLFSALLGRAKSLRTAMLYATLSLALMLVMPINLLTPGNRYLGYLIPHAYHNPTIVVLKPLALVLFYVSARCFDARPLPRPVAYTAGAAIATLLAVLAKPSYVIALAPALSLVAAHALWRGAPVHWRLLVYGVLLPIALGVGVQMTFMSARRSFVFAPLAVFHEWARLINPAAASHLPLKFLLSILFPLAVYVCCLRLARGALYLNLAWLTFAVGAAYTYLLAESGNDLGLGNFTWSAQITVFVLFVASAVFFLGWATRDAPRGSVAATATIALVGLVFVLHLVSGLEWYGLHTGWLPMGYIIAVW
jgi:hypothetical protein